MKYIPLSKGRRAIIDDADFALIGGLTWHLHETRGKEYARRRQTLMHRLIIDPLPGQEVDHINGDGLDNRRANLRVVSRSQNMMNAGRGRNAAGSKGVDRQGRGKPWRARITIEGKTKNLGRFSTKSEASNAYDQAAREHFGVFARPNCR